MCFILGPNERMHSSNHEHDGRVIDSLQKIFSDKMVLCINSALRLDDSLLPETCPKVNFDIEFQMIKS